MTRFVNVNFPTVHPGVARAEALVASAGNLKRNFDPTKSLATMLLAALVSALVVVADQVIDIWADGHLFAAWVALWSVAFVAMALFASTARGVAAKLSSAYSDWSARAQHARDEAQYWESAKNDPRIMADLQAAITRSEKVETAPVKAVAREVYSPMAAFEARKISGSYLRNF